MAANIDRAILDKALDVSEAVGDGAALTSEPSLRAALQLVVGRVRDARTELAEAAREAESDASENRRASLAFADAVERAIGVYRNLQASARPRLVDLDPDEADELGADEIQARQDVFAAAFPLSASELRNLGRVAVRGRLHETLERVTAAPDHVPRSDTKRLERALKKVDETHEAVREEMADDAAVAERLGVARAAAQRQAGALLELAATVLRTEGASLSMDALVQRARATRQASAPAAEAPTDEPVG